MTQIYKMNSFYDEIHYLAIFVLTKSAKSGLEIDFQLYEDEYLEQSREYTELCTKTGDWIDFNEFIEYQRKELEFLIVMTMPEALEYVNQGGEFAKELIADNPDLIIPIETEDTPKYGKFSHFKKQITDDSRRILELDLELLEPKNGKFPVKGFIGEIVEFDTKQQAVEFRINWRVLNGLSPENGQNVLKSDC